MGEGDKKPFIKSGAFKLILIWIALGVVLHLAIKLAAAPKMEAACAAWHQAAPPATEGEGGEAETKPAEEFKNACEMAEKLGTTHRNLTAAFFAITNMPGATAWAIPNFLVLVTILVYFAKDPINNNLKQRREELAKAIAEAQRARAEAEAKKAEYEKKLEEIGQAIEALKAEMRSEGEAEKARLIEEAGRQAARIKNEAEFTARQELLSARYRLREEAAQLAVKVAEQVIRETISAEDRDRLLKEYLEKVTEQSA